MSKSKPCGRKNHCWHVTSSVTNGMGVKGWHNETCCHCDRKQRRHWEIVEDKNHGPYCPETIQRFGVVEDVQ